MIFWISLLPGLADRMVPYADWGRGGRLAGWPKTNSFACNAVLGRAELGRTARVPDALEDALAADDGRDRFMWSRELAL